MSIPFAEAAIVAAGGGLGAAARLLLGAAVTGLAGGRAYMGTFAVNMAGSFLIGALAFALDGRDGLRLWRLLLVTGVLGGFTTFSSFSLETLSLFREGKAGLGLAYALLCPFLGAALALAGYWIASLAARGR